MGSAASTTRSASLEQQAKLQTNLNPSASDHILSGNTDESSFDALSFIPKIKVSANKFMKAKQQAEKDARKKILWEYPELKDALNLVQEMMKDIDQRKEDEFLRKNMSMKTKKNLEELYNLYFDQEEAEHRKILGDELAKDNAGYIFTEYFRVLTSGGKESPVNPQEYKAQCVYLLRSNCWNYSDSSLELSKELGRMGLIPLLVKSLLTYEDSYGDDENIFTNIVLPDISILHNAAKATDNKKYYKEAKAVSAILPYTKTTNQELKMIAIMTLAYVVDEQDNKIISTDDSMIKYILMYLDNAIKASDRKHNGFSAEELVSGLMHLASNGENSSTIVDAGILPMLVKLMRSGSGTEKEICAKTVWVLAFNNENKDKITKEPSMEDALNEIAEGAQGPGKNAASGALWVLGRIARKVNAVEKTSLLVQKSSKPGSMLRGGSSNSEVSSSPPITMSMPARVLSEDSEMSERERAHPPPPPKSNRLGDFLETPKNAEEDLPQSDKISEEDDESDVSILDENVRGDEAVTQSEDKHVMISYQWDCQRVMIRIKNKLEAVGYRVWIDVESMGGSTLQAMAEAVENSEVVLMSMSSKYKESPNCRTEAEYAYKLKKSIIPLRVEPSYEPDGWLGAILGAKLYHDFSNLMAFENTFSKLLKELGDRGKTNSQPAAIAPRFVSPTFGLPPPTKRIPPNQWSKTEVTTWAVKNGIMSKKIWALDGAALEFLLVLKMEAPEFFYKYLSEKLGVVELSELMKLNKGLKNLSL